MLLADEPTGNLDSRTSEQIHQLFFSVNEQRKTTIIIVTHNAALAAGMGRVVTLRDGRVEHDERRKAAGYREADAQLATNERVGTGKVDVG
jgi:lipoprotein-releasing system ATP-binding protein